MVTRITPAGRRRRLAAAAALAVAACGGCAAAPDSPAVSHLACPVAGGRQIEGLPDIVLPCLGRPSRTASASSTHGRPQLLNVWASWCAPCRRELPLLEAAHREAGSRVLFLGVDVRDSRSRALRFLADHHVSYAQLFDAEGTLARAFRFAGVPDTVVVDARGRVVYRHAGELDAGQLRLALSRVGLRGVPRPAG